MIDPGLRDQLLSEGRRQARIHGVDMECAEVYAEGWRAAAEAAQPSVDERERELSLARHKVKALEQRIAEQDWVGQHRTAWIEDPLRRQVQVLQDRIAKVRQLCAKADEPIRCTVCVETVASGMYCHLCHGSRLIESDKTIATQAVLAVLDEEGEKADADPA